jgi:hypothetical protein
MRLRGLLMIAVKAFMGMVVVLAVVVAVIVGSGQQSGERLRAFDGCALQLAGVELKQIAVTTLQSLGLDARKLQGAAIEGTQGLPGLLPPSNDHGDNDGQNNNHAHEGFDGDHQQPAQSHHRKNIFADDASIF